MNSHYYSQFRQIKWHLKKGFFFYFVPYVFDFEYYEDDINAIFHINTPLINKDIQTNKQKADDYTEQSKPNQPKILDGHHKHLNNLKAYCQKMKNIKFIPAFRRKKNFYRNYINFRKYINIQTQKIVEVENNNKEKVH